MRNFNNFTDYLNYTLTRGIKVGPFRITRNIDPYNYESRPGYRMHGHCQHLAAGGATQYANLVDALSWATLHVTKYHAEV